MRGGYEHVRNSDDQLLFHHDRHLHDVLDPVEMYLAKICSMVMCSVCCSDEDGFKGRMEMFLKRLGRPASRAMNIRFP